MFSLISGFVKWLFTKPTARFLVIGLDNVGKTTTLESIKAAAGQRALSPELISPTLGFNVAVVNVEGVNAFFWDVSGQTTLRTMWSQYYRDSDAILYVADVSDRDRLQESVSVLRNVMQHESFGGRTEPLPVVILLNKLDLLIPAERGARCAEFESSFMNIVASIDGPRICEIAAGSALVEGPELGAKISRLMVACIGSSPPVTFVVDKKISELKIT